MLSRQIDLAALEIRQSENQRDEKHVENFKEVTRRQGLSQDLKRGSLRVLKKLLAQQKAQNDSVHAMSAAGPFSEMSLSQISGHKSEACKIDPSAQVMQLFEKILDKLVYAAKEGIQKTTFYLDSTAFRSSIFKGAQITITEYSTAPKCFNIQFTADPKAVEFFQLHAADLQNALNNGGHLFEINRIDTSVQTEDEKHAIKAVSRDEGEEDES